MTDKNCALVIFSKAPVPGQVKTRLISELGTEGAAGLYMKLVKHTLRIARQSSLHDIFLYCSPDTSHPFFVSCAQEFGLQLRTQQGEDLGLRMAAAIDEALGCHDAVIITGCDCPGLLAADLDQAAKRLNSGSDVVLGPSEDGGYYLIGLAGSQPGLFSGVDWGQPDVLAVTRERVAGLGLDLFELPVRWDIDRPNDVYRYLDECDPGGR